MKKAFLFALGFTCISNVINAQAIQKLQLQLDPSNTNSSVPFVGCGSPEVMQLIEKDAPGFIEQSNDFLMNVANEQASNTHRNSSELYRIPVVFHVVYNNFNEQLPDTLIENQIALLNEIYRRQNADTVNMRPAFADLVGDAQIEFFLATEDPDGNQTTGIEYTASNVANFGGTLPYGPGQNQQISDWVNDSLYYNFFRITKDSLGGSDAWDINKYMNVWVGDLSILEPQFNNVEEIVFFGLSTPPANHPNFPDTSLNQIYALGHGTLMHYQAIGPNNPVPFQAPYAAYNGITNTGKMLAHEAGHYLGLRHIWGDGNCSMDDYVDDTPRASASSQYNCNLSINSCIDTINGANLPNMVENYMDYSSSDCQNSFTKGQIAVMRATLENFRSDLYVTSVSEVEGFEGLVSVYPNPVSENLQVVTKDISGKADVLIYNLNGSVIHQSTMAGNDRKTISMKVPSGIYFVKVVTQNGSSVSKVVKQ